MPRIAGRIRSLDGLRALSIALVLVSHLLGTQHVPALDELSRWRLASLGVRVFFVISGFLITTLLLEESDRSGVFSLSRFYLRRLFRIFPALYALCAALWLLDRAELVALRPGDLGAAATFTMNYHHDRAWYAGHLWSLSVEEQFYLVWPVLLRLVGLRGGLWLAVVVVVVAPVLRLALGFSPSLRPGIGESFVSVADALATGCVLAATRPRLAGSPRLRRLVESRLFWLAPIAVALCARNPYTKLDWLLGQTAMNLGIAVIIERTLRRPDDLLGRMLNARPLVRLGVLSYSLYLWQQPFLNRHGDAALQGFPWNLALAGLAALASYHLIEQPFLRLRVRLERRGRRRAAAGDQRTRTSISVVMTSSAQRRL